MSTSAQIHANRTNATLSTGPRSDAGKSTVSRNAVSHGLSSAAPVLACEDHAAFDTLVAGLISEFHPDGEHETFLVCQMAAARWRLARIRRIETASFNLMLGDADPEHPDTRLAQALLDHGDALSKLERYAAAAERSYYKAHQQLLASTKARQAAQAAAKPQPTDKAILDMLFEVPDCKTKPNSTALDFDSFDDDELEALTRPPALPETGAHGEPAAR